MEKVAEDRYKKYIELMLRSRAQQQPDKKEEIEELIKEIPNVMKISPIQVNPKENSLTVKDEDTK